MAQREWLSEQFELNRSHLRAMAHRMLGSMSEADTALLESWLRINQPSERINDMAGWLTMVVARASLDVLRARTSDLKGPAGNREAAAKSTDELRPASDDALLADAVAIALLIALDPLEPAERVAIVLHDLFAVSSDEAAKILERSPRAAREVTARARRRFHRVAGLHEPDSSSQRDVVARFLAAAQHRDMEAVRAVLDPDVIFRSDGAAVTLSGEASIRGSAAVTESAARAAAKASDVAIVAGEAALIVAPLGRLMTLFRFTVAKRKIVRIEAITDPAQLHDIEMSVLNQ